MQGYLNYQVIHHLFPTMPQCRGPQVSKELQVKAKQWGIQYTTVSSS
jgi:fatty acid desaturase